MAGCSTTDILKTTARGAIGIKCLLVRALSAVSPVEVAGKDSRCASYISAQLKLLSTNKLPS